MCQRRPSEQLTPSLRPQLDSDAGERQDVSPFTDNSGRHTVRDYWATLIHPLSSASGAQFYLHCVSVARPSHSLLTQNVLRRCLSQTLYLA